MLFKQKVTQKAHRQASHFFFDNHMALKPKRTKEEVTHLAQEEAEHFYQQGTLFFLLKASRLGTKEDVIATYQQAFLEDYQTNTQEHPEDYDILKGIPNSVLPEEYQRETKNE